MQKTIRKAESALQRSDPVIARLIEQHGPCTLFSGNSLFHAPHFAFRKGGVEEISLNAKGIELIDLVLHQGYQG